MDSTGISKLSEFLDQVGGDNTFQMIAHLGNRPYPCMDVTLDLVHDDADAAECPDYYGWDFKKVRQEGHPIYMLFFTGASNYFPGIVSIQNVPLEQCPIYIFDLSGGEPTIEAVGNFRHYMEVLLNFLIDYEGAELDGNYELDEIAETRHLCKEGLIYLKENFSTVTIFPDYEVEIPNIYEPNIEIGFGTLTLKNQIEIPTHCEPIAND